MAPYFITHPDPKIGNEVSIIIMRKVLCVLPLIFRCLYVKHVKPVVLNRPHYERVLKLIYGSTSLYYILFPKYLNFNLSSRTKSIYLKIKVSILTVLHILGVDKYYLCHRGIMK